MIRKTLFSIVFLTYYAFGQETYFEVGVNNTSYNYTHQSSNNDFELDSSPGIFLRVGIGELLPNLDYGFSYHQFNSMGRLYEDTFEWNTNYVGGFIQFDYSLVSNKLMLTPAAEILTLFSGKQFSFGEIYTLGEEPEFTGLWVSPRLGVMYKVDYSNYISLGVGYSFSISLNATNSTDESLIFNSHQLSIKFDL